MMRTRILILVSVVVSFPTAVHAQQAHPDSVKLRNDCRLATQVLQTGHPSARFGWATAQLHYCGVDALAEANVTALRRLRSSPDTTAVAQLWNQLQYVRDARVYRAVMEIAQDPASTATARVDALLWLLRLRRPQQFATREEVTGGFDADGNVRGGCGRSGRLAGTPRAIVGVPLPADYEERITEVGRRVAADPAQPLDVRTAARCAQTLGYSIPLVNPSTVRSVPRS